MADTGTEPEVGQENDKRVTRKIIIESDGTESTTDLYDT